MHHNPAAVKARSALLPMLGLLLAACQAVPPPRAIDTTRTAQGDIASWPAGREFIVDTEASDLRIVIESAGRLARFGHPHVLGGPVLSGRVVLSDDWTTSALELSVQLEDIVLDQPEWRIAEGFPPELPDGAIEATRENLMSAAVLDLSQHPTIQIRSLGLIGPAFQPDLDVRITLRGEARDLTVPISLDLNGDTLIATGRFSFLQSDFGIEPFSALGGALAISDALLVRFRIVARAGSAAHRRPGLHPRRAVSALGAKTGCWRQARAWTVGHVRPTYDSRTPETGAAQEAQRIVGRGYIPGGRSRPWVPKRDVGDKPGHGPSAM